MGGGEPSFYGVEGCELLGVVDKKPPLYQLYYYSAMLLLFFDDVFSVVKCVGLFLILSLASGIDPTSAMTEVSEVGSDLVENSVGRTKKISMKLTLEVFVKKVVMQES